jgi:protein-tyrosine phosphatase
MNVTETVVIAAHPDQVWEVVGNPGAIADWVPAIESSHLDGDVRHATFAGGGGDATERIVEHDDAGRSYLYEFLSGPLPLEVYRSRLSVRDHAEGAEVVWVADFTAGSPEAEAELAEAIGGIYRGSLVELKGRVES